MGVGRERQSQRGPERGERRRRKYIQKDMKKMTSLRNLIEKRAQKIK